MGNIHIFCVSMFQFNFQNIFSITTIIAITKQISRTVTPMEHKMLIAELKLVLLSKKRNSFLRYKQMIQQNVDISCPV